jgi:hypothetical protein
MMWKSIAEQALASLDSYLRVSQWFGREHEVVNLFAHRFLLPMCAEGSPLSSPTQIGIEVAVPQVEAANRKRLVCKDLVLWPEAEMTVWGHDGSLNVPSVIFEWKTNDEGKCRGDIEWLKEFTQKFQTTLGYAVCANLIDERQIVFWRVEQGRVANKSFATNPAVGRN